MAEGCGGGDSVHVKAVRKQRRMEGLQSRSAHPGHVPSDLPLARPQLLTATQLLTAHKPIIFQESPFRAQEAWGPSRSKSQQKLFCSCDEKIGGSRGGPEIMAADATESTVVIRLQRLLLPLE